ncbi:hypothetical protein [Streptomyces lincolnensis]|uniref:hypothetical protein n=1 Tax=Streptomyces lincolnensis TaxID=1915 RepID=UPI0037D51853
MVWPAADEVARHTVGLATDSALARLEAPLRQLPRRPADAGMEGRAARSRADAVVSRPARETALERRRAAARCAAARRDAGRSWG